ncbi:MAG: TerC family protein [Chloroflexota bacterium]|nr:TerC family protein [Chloroflexota bacterium]
MGDIFSGETLQAIIAIIIIDLVLSGDNAVIIGMAARQLSPANRRRAILIGGVGAIGLRIIFTALAALLLDIPLLQAGGGLLLLWIAYKLVTQKEHDAHVSEAGSLSQAIRTIILADVVMSLDNILAVGGAADGHLWLLLFGLALSIPIILFGSSLVADLLNRYPFLIYVGVIVLIHTAIGMVLEDDVVHDQFQLNVFAHYGLIIALSVAMVAVGMRLRRQQIHDTLNDDARARDVARGAMSRELH